MGGLQRILFWQIILAFSKFLKTPCTEFKSNLCDSELSMSIFHVSITFTTDHSFYSKNCSEVSPFLYMEILLQKCCKQWRHQFVWPSTQLKKPLHTSPRHPRLAFH